MRSINSLFSKQALHSSPHEAKTLLSSNTRILDKASLLQSRTGCSVSEEQECPFKTFEPTNISNPLLQCQDSYTWTRPTISELADLAVPALKSLADFVDRNMCTEGATHLTCHFGCSVIGGSQVITLRWKGRKLELQFSMFHIISIYSKMGQQPKKNKNQIVLVLCSYKSILFPSSLSTGSDQTLLHQLWGQFCVSEHQWGIKPPQKPHTHCKNRHTHINRGLYWRAEFIWSLYNRFLWILNHS